MIAGVLFFVLHASGTLSVLNSVNIWLFSVIPVVLWILVFCIRGYLYGRELERFQFFTQEAEHAQQQWTAWAERYIAVLANCVLLPERISAALLLKNARGLEQFLHLIRRIDYLEDKSPLSLLLSGVRETISALPAELPLQVTLLTDEPDRTRQEWLSQFDQSWLETYPTRPGPASINLTEQLAFSMLDERLRQPESSVHLVLLMQLQGETSYSDGLAALVFTSDDVAEKYALAHSVRVLRPMPLDMDHFNDDLALFLTTQTKAIQTASVLADHQKWKESTAGLLGTGNALGTKWQAEDMTTVETYCGIQGPYSPWLTLALGADFVRIGQQSWLALSTTGAENFVYTITSGSGDERVK
ncbi:type VI secretion protein [Rahnella sikkimica]|uniref:Type VI secretion protein n=1 Tax=Rahnella sikkimica TaxID=1805933 RepID=A0A2L1UX63_9GAMM|nr:type VI secretion protein [Rahnella sikkimica]AVF37530.1 hypothetical protein BV494_21580 [Rahnella sikkimica]